MNIHPYNENSEIYNFIFHPLHHPETKKWSIIANVFLTIATGFLWLIPFLIVNQLDNRKLTEWKAQHSPTTGKTHQAAASLLQQHSPLERMKNFFSCYQNGYSPTANRQNLENYIQSDDFDRHAQATRVYYNANELRLNDAKQVVLLREPVNIAMNRYYDSKELQEKYGYEVSVYNDPNAKKVDGTSFSDAPNTVCIYTEAYLWNPPGGGERKEVAVLHLPAPALDISTQPHYKYYIQEDSTLDTTKYEAEMRLLAKIIVKTAIDHKTSAFGEKGLKRLIISRYGQANFLSALEEADKKIAHGIFYSTLVEEIEANKEQLSGLEIVISEYGKLLNSEMENKFVSPLTTKGLEKVGIINGDIKENARDGDLIVNAWDPHSAIGNGNDKDNSFDGQIGRSTSAILVGTPQINPYMDENECYIDVK